MSQVTPAIHMPDNLPHGKNTRIAVAMSGGVDSSMVAYYLKQAGYNNLIGFTAWTLNGPGKCCNDALINAGRVCEELGMEYDTVDLRGEFAHFVMNHYKASYEDGLTPNPCVECNRHVKWEALLDYATEKLGAEFIATGHYARIEHTSSGPHIYRAADERKDQTYMMARVKKEHLAKTLFPLADILKPDLLTDAKAVDIPTAHSKESQDICFVLDGQANYLKTVLGAKPGEIRDIETNTLLGEHDGYYLFTIGQRKGLGVAAGRPVYVVKIDKETNTVYVGDAHHLACPRVDVIETSWIQEPPADATGAFQSMVKYRYNTPAALANCQIQPDGHINVQFLSPASAISPGQIAAFYDVNNTELWGGGYLQKHLSHTAFDENNITLPTYDSVCNTFK